MLPGGGSGEGDAGAGRADDIGERSVAAVPSACRWDGEERGADYVSPIVHYQTGRGGARANSGAGAGRFDGCGLTTRCGLSGDGTAKTPGALRKCQVLRDKG